MRVSDVVDRGRISPVWTRSAARARASVGNLDDLDAPPPLEQLR